MDGKDLRLRRIAMDVSVTSLAEAIGCQPSQINRWENHRRVTAKAVERYLTGLATFGTIPTVEVRHEAVA